jgi:hypothetical protein
MATQAAKAERRAVGLNELKRLTVLIAEHLNVDVPDVLGVNNRDPELAQIQQIELINDLLTKVLESNGVGTAPPDPSDELAHMTKAQLLQKADAEGVEVPKSATKAQIIEALRTK